MVRVRRTHFLKHFLLFRRQCILSHNYNSNKTVALHVTLLSIIKQDNACAVENFAQSFSQDGICKRHCLLPAALELEKMYTGILGPGSVWPFETSTPPPFPRSFSAVLLSVSDFLAQKYLVDYQLLLQRSQQTFNYLANKENKVRVEEQSKKPHNPPKLCTKARATAPWNKWAKPPANKLIDKMRLAMKLASLFVIYFCSLFACLLAFAVNKTQQEILKCNI